MPVSYQSAIAKAKTVTRWTYGMCDNFVANMYGYSHSGYNTAIEHWRDTPSSLKHPGDMKAPAGALMFWSGGDGHVALSLGDGNIVSTDIGGPSTVSTAPASDITTKWGKPYLGWAYPYFQGSEASTTIGKWTGSTSVAGGAQNVGILDNISPDNLAEGFVGAIAKPFSSVLSFMMWGFETLAGMALIGFGIYVMRVGQP